MTLFILFLWIDGQMEPTVATRDQSACWEAVKVVEEAGMTADCRVAVITTNILQPDN